MTERDESHRESFKAAVRLIDGHRRQLQEAGANEELISSLSAIIRHLHRMPSFQIDRLYGVREPGDARQRLERAIQAAEHLSLLDIEQSIEREDIPRLELEAIAIGRFHVPRGSMRSLGNLDRLREKLRTFVQNEKTHAVISEVARNAK